MYNAKQLGNMIKCVNEESKQLEYLIKQLSNSGVKVSEGDVKADFYVKSNGEAVPATGYRYMDSKYAEETMKSMSGPGSYFGFKKFDSASVVQDRYYQNGVIVNYEENLIHYR